MKINFNFEEKNVKLGLENQFTIQEFLEVTPVKILMLKGEKGDTVSAEWGTITGDIADQTDLATELDTKADKSTTYTKTEVDTALETKADTTDIPDVSDFITKDVDNLTNYTKTSDLSAVATSGDYDDLDNKPTIPSKTSDLTNDSGYIDNTVDNLTNYTKTSNLSTVATSGSYSDLSNKPTIPSKTSDLTNDSNFAVTNADNKFSVGQTIAGETVVDSIRTKNIFGNYTIINGWIYGTTLRVNSENGNRMAFVKCKANTTYTISRSILTGTFRVSDYTTIPPMTSSNVDYTIPTAIENNNGTTITYTTSSTAQYLIVHYGVIEDTNLNESLSTIQIEEGNTATAYSPYQQLENADSGWINMTLETGFTNYNSNDISQYRKRNGVLFLQGAIKNTSQISSNQTTLFSTLPEGYRPTKEFFTVCQGSDMNKWLLKIGKNGQCTIERYGTTSNSAIPQNTWLPFCCSFITD